MCAQMQAMRACSSTVRKRETDGKDRNEGSETHARKSPAARFEGAQRAEEGWNGGETKASAERGSEREGRGGGREWNLGRERARRQPASLQAAAILAVAVAVARPPSAALPRAAARRTATSDHSHLCAPPSQARAPARRALCVALGSPALTSSSRPDAPPTPHRPSPAPAPHRTRTHPSTPHSSLTTRAHRAQPASQARSHPAPAPPPPPARIARLRVACARSVSPPPLGHPARAP